MNAATISPIACSRRSSSSGRIGAFERLEAGVGQLQTTTSGGFADVGARLDLIVALLRGDPD